MIGTHNSPASAEVLRSLGAKPVLLDLLDARAVREAVLESGPEAIVHEATALANAKFGRSLDKMFRGTNALRTGAPTPSWRPPGRQGCAVVAQSFAPYRYIREGGPVKTEDDPLDPTPPADAGETFAAMAHLDEAVTGFGGIALRYGAFYGAPEDGWGDLVRQRSSRSSAKGAASSRGSTSTTPPRRPSWRSTTRGPRS